MFQHLSLPVLKSRGMAFAKLEVNLQEYSFVSFYTEHPRRRRGLN